MRNNFLVVFSVLVAFALSGCASFRQSPSDVEAISATPEDLSVIKRQEREKIAFPVPQSTVGDTIDVNHAKLKASSLITTVDSRDAAFAEDALVRALESGRVGSRINWRNPDTGNSGEVLPGLKLKVSGQDCRQFSHITLKDGKTSQVTKTACKNDSGAWQELSTN